MPSVHKKGLGYGKGSQSYYPEHAFSYAIAANAYLKKARKRETVGWSMWLDGFDVADRYWKEPIIARAKRLDAIADKLRAAFNSGSTTDVYALLHKFIRQNNLPPLLKQIRKALGRDRTMEFLEKVALIFIGDFLELGSGAARCDDLQAQKTAEIGLLSGGGRFAKIGQERFYTGQLASEFQVLANAFSGVKWRELAGDREALQQSRGLLANSRALASDFHSAAIKAGGPELEKLAKRMNATILITDIDIQITQLLMLQAWNRDGAFQNALDALVQRSRDGT